MGCSTFSSLKSLTSASQKNLTVSEYKAAVEDGALLSTIVVGKVICDSLGSAPNECERLKNKMAELVLLSVKEIPDSQIKDRIKSGIDYREGMKDGARVFKDSVGNTLCKSLKATHENCVNIRTEIEEGVFEIIDRFSEENLKKVRKQVESTDLLS